MIFKFRTNLRKRQARHILRQHHRMRISHGYTAHFPLSVRHKHGPVQHLLFIGKHGDFRCLQDRTAHVYAHPLHTSVCHVQLQLLHAARAHHGDLRLIRQVFVVDELRHATDSVSAHLRTASVRIVHLHFKIRLLRRIDENHAVPADPEMAVAHFPDKIRLSFLRNLLCGPVNIDVIIAAAVHFGKFYFHSFFLPSTAWPQEPSLRSLPYYFRCPCCISADICGLPPPSSGYGP